MMCIGTPSLYSQQGGGKLICVRWMRVCLGLDVEC